MQLKLSILSLIKELSREILIVPMLQVVTRDLTAVHFSCASSFLYSSVPNFISLSISPVPLPSIFFSSLLIRIQPVTNRFKLWLLQMPPSPAFSRCFLWTVFRHFLTLSRLLFFIYFIFVVRFFQLHLSLNFPLAEVFHFLLNQWIVRKRKRGMTWSFVDNNCDRLLHLSFELYSYR